MRPGAWHGVVWHGVVWRGVAWGGVGPSRRGHSSPVEFVALPGSDPAGGRAVGCCLPLPRLPLRCPHRLLTKKLLMID